MERRSLDDSRRGKAHELGHLLFNSNAHSSDGIMIASFGYKQIVQASRGQFAVHAGTSRAHPFGNCAPARKMNLKQTLQIRYN